MNFVQNELQQCEKNNSKWKVIRNCVPRKESTQPTYSRDMKTLADKKNAFFTSVGAKAAADSASLLANSDFNDISSSFTAQQLYPDSEQFQFRAALMQEIRKIALSFPSRKAPGCDKVPMQIIKDALPCILPILTDIVNHSRLYSHRPGRYQKLFLYSKKGSKRWQIITALFRCFLLHLKYVKESLSISSHSL